MVNAVKLPVNTSATALQMAETMFGKGVTVTSATYSGGAASKGIFSNGLSTSPGVLSANSGVILSTGNASAFTNASGQANQQVGTGTDVQGGVDGNARLNAISNLNTFDGSILETTFVPEGSILTMQIMFSSEEYPEYVNQGFNDAVGIFVNGQRAELSIGSGDISIDNINAVGENRNLYVDNSSGSPYNTEMDGFTLTLTLKAPVNPGVANTLWLGIADAGDPTYDSNLVVYADSVQTEVIAYDDNIDVLTGTTKSVNVLTNDTGPLGLNLTVTEINGIAVSPGDSVTLASGTVVTLQGNGTLTISSSGGLSSEAISYKISDGAGTTDIGFVNVSVVPCFTSGTRIATPHGTVNVEDLSVGDYVQTRDGGAQPIRWIRHRTVAASGAFSPVVIAENTFGSHQRIELSPLHRVMLSEGWAELLFGEAEVLVKAKDLINDRSVTQRNDGGDVTYIHILFDRHEVVEANGLACESYLPGPETLAGFDAETQGEIFAFFPELDRMTGKGYGPTARRVLKGYEARVLLA